MWDLRHRPTTCDVARAAGVSTSTASRTFPGRLPIGLRARHRPFTAASGFGCQASPAANRPATSRSLLLALVVPDLHNPHHATVARGVEDRAARAGLSVMVANTDLRADKEERVLALLDRQRVDGIIFVTDTRPVQPALERLARDGFPVVTIHEELEGDFDFDLVVADNEAGGRAAGAHLLGLGHVDLAVVCGPQGLPTTRARLGGFQSELARAGVAPAPVVYADDRLPGGREAAGRLLGRSPRPTAVFAANDLMALGVLSVARERRLDVPGDLSLVGFDDIPFAAMVHPPLTTVAQPAVKLGETAVELLLDARSDPGRPSRRVQLPVELRVRASAARPRPPSAARGRP